MHGSQTSSSLFTAGREADETLIPSAVEGQQGVDRARPHGARFRYGSSIGKQRAGSLQAEEEEDDVGDYREDVGRGQEGT